MTLLGQWHNYFRKYAPHRIKVNLFYGSSRKIKENCHVIITTIGVIRSEIGSTGSIHKLSEIIFDRICFDESHKMCAVNTQSFECLNRIRGLSKWCISATPFSNNDLFTARNQLQWLQCVNTSDYRALRKVHDYFNHRIDSCVFEIFKDCCVRSSFQQEKILLPKIRQNFTAFTMNDDRYETLKENYKRCGLGPRVLERMHAFNNLLRAWID